MAEPAAGPAGTAATTDDRVVVDDRVLAEFPLPRHDGDATKYDRGSVLVAGGSPGTPGAVLLAGLAALRAGAGKLQLAVPGPVATALAVAVPPGALGRR